MASVNNENKILGFLYSALNLSNNAQLSVTAEAKANNATAEKAVDYSDGLSLFEMEEIDKNFGNNDGVLEYNEFAKAYNGSKSFEADDSLKGTFNNLIESYKVQALNSKYGKKKTGADITNLSTSDNNTVSFKIDDVAYAKNGSAETKYNSVGTMITEELNNNGNITKTIKNEYTETNVKITPSGKDYTSISAVFPDKTTQLNIDIVKDEEDNLKELYLDGHKFSNPTTTKNGKIVFKYIVKRNKNGTVNAAKLIVTERNNKSKEYKYVDENGKTQRSIVINKNGEPKYIDKYEYTQNGETVVTRTYCMENKIEKLTYNTYEEKNENGEVLYTLENKLLSKETLICNKTSNAKTNEDGSKLYTISTKDAEAQITSKDSKPSNIKVSKPVQFEISDIQNHNTKEMSLSIEGLIYSYDKELENNGADNTYVLKADDDNKVIVKVEKNKTIYEIITAEDSKKIILDKENKPISVINNDNKIQFEEIEKEQTQTTKYSYSELGKKKSEVTTYEDRPFDKKETEYDSNGQITKDSTTTFIKGKNVITEVQYLEGEKQAETTADEDGNLIKTEYGKDEDGNKTEVTTYPNNTTSTVVYNGDGKNKTKKLSEITKDQDGNITSETTWNNKGIKTSEIKTNDDGSKTAKEYNENGKITKETVTDINGKTINEVTYIYKDFTYVTTTDYINNTTTKDKYIKNTENKLDTVTYSGVEIKKEDGKITNDKLKKAKYEYTEDGKTLLKETVTEYKWDIGKQETIPAVTTTSYEKNGYKIVTKPNGTVIYYDTKGKVSNLRYYTDDMFRMLIDDESSRNYGNENSCAFNPNTFSIEFNNDIRYYYKDENGKVFLSTADKTAKLDCAYFAAQSFENNTNAINYTYIANAYDEKNEKCTKKENATCTKTLGINPATFTVTVPYGSRVKKYNSKNKNTEYVYETSRKTLYFTKDANGNVKEVTLNEYNAYNCTYIATHTEAYENAKTEGKLTEGKNNTFFVTVGNTTKYYKKENGTVVEIKLNKYNNLNK